MTSIAIVVTCKGRLHHLQQSLPRFVSEVPSEIIVVDYGCPDRASDWVDAHFAGITLVRVHDDPGFCLGRARNLGAMQARSEWLAFLDADTLIQDGWHDWMQAHLQPGHFYRRGLIEGERDAETHGVVVCARADFLAAGGYDELYRGWGGEDEDLYGRLDWLGVREAAFPWQLLGAISHGDDERAGWEGLRSRQEVVDLCACYRLAKLTTLRLLDMKGELPINLRRGLMENARQELTRWFDSGRTTDLTINFRVTVGDKWVAFPISFTADPPESPA